MTFTTIEVSFLIILSFLLYEKWYDLKQFKAKKSSEVIISSEQESTERN